MVGEDLEGDAVLLLRQADLFVELGVVDGQTAVAGEDFERRLVLAGEDAEPFVEHLDDADDGAADRDGHAQDRPRPEARLLVHAAVEARVRVGVRNVQHLSVGLAETLFRTHLPLLSSVVNSRTLDCAERFSAIGPGAKSNNLVLNEDRKLVAFKREGCEPRR